MWASVPTPTSPEEEVFLDEPLNGLDANAALVVKGLLRELASEGRTILFCSHILEVVERVCTRIVIIDKGRKIIEGSPERIAAETGAGSLEEAFARVTGVLAVLMAVLTTAALIRYGGRRLSLSYAERLGALVAVSEARRRRTGPEAPARVGSRPNCGRS